MDILRPNDAFVSCVGNNSQDYVSTVNPEPVPTQVDIILSVFDIIDVNEAQQTVKLMFKIILEWQIISLLSLPFTPLFPTQDTKPSLGRRRWNYQAVIRHLSNNRPVIVKQFWVAVRHAGIKKC